MAGGLGGSSERGVLFFAPPTQREAHRARRKTQRGDGPPNPPATRPTQRRPRPRRSPGTAGRGGWRCRRRRGGGCGRGGRRRSPGESKRPAAEGDGEGRRSAPGRATPSADEARRVVAQVDDLRPSATGRRGSGAGRGRARPASPTERRRPGGSRIAAAAAAAARSDADAGEDVAHGSALLGLRATRAGRRGASVQAHHPGRDQDPVLAEQLHPQLVAAGRRRCRRRGCGRPSRR